MTGYLKPYTLKITGMYKIQVMVGYLSFVLFNLKMNATSMQCRDVNQFR